jgi:TolB protein
VRVQEGSSRMKRMTAAVRSVAVVLAALALAACEPIDEGGGAGVDGPLTFQSGYVFVRGQDLYLANSVDPNVVQRLTNSGSVRHPALTRDGTRVVFARFSGVAAELVTVSTTQGATPSVLLSASGTGGTNLRHPTFSPDGQFVVFVYDVGTVSFLGRVNADGTGFTLLAGTNSRSYGAPSFLPNGTAVLAPAGAQRAQLDQLDLVQIATRQVTFAGDLSSGSEGPLTLANRVAVSPDGTRIAYDASSETAQPRVYVAAFNQVAQPAERLTSLTEGVESFPIWASTVDVAFSSSAGGADNVYTARAAGSLPAGSAPLVLPAAQQPWFGPL